MKILLVNDYIEPIGGTEGYIFNLKKELEKRGHIVKLFGSNKTKEQYIQSQQRKSVGKYINKIFNIKLYFAFQKILREFQPDIIHLHNIYNELSPGILLGVHQKNIIMTVHDTLLVNPVSVLSERNGNNCRERTCIGCNNCIGWKGAMYERVKHWIHKPLLSKIRLFITPSNFMADFMREAGFNPVKVIPNGIELFSFAPITNWNNLLYVGRLSKDKGVEVLLKAFADVLKVHPRVQLSLVGSGPDRDYFVKVAEKLSISSNVTFTGAQNKKQIEEYYKQSTIVVVPSIFPDNFPTVCIEALSVGRPIIGSNIGGIPEMVDNQFLFNPKDHEDLFRRIISMLSHIKMRTPLNKINKDKVESYTIIKNTTSVENEYQLLI